MKMVSSFSLFGFILTLLLLSASFISTVSTQQLNPPIQRVNLCLLLADTVSDLGYNFMHNEGRLMALKKLEAQYPTVSFDSTVQDNIGILNNSAQDELYADLVARRRCTVIIANSAAIAPRMLIAAGIYPNITFVLTTDVIRTTALKNVVIVFGRLYQSAFMAGMVAGMAFKADTTPSASCIGFVASQTFPTVRLTVNAFTLGIQSVVSNVTVHTIPLGQWLWEEGEGQAADLLAQKGCRIIAYRSNSRTTSLYVNAREKAGLRSIGYSSDVRRFVGESVLTSYMNTFDSIYVTIGQEVIENRTRPGFRFPGISEGGTVLSELSYMAAPGTAEVLQRHTLKFASGWDVFCGNISDNSRVLRINNTCPSDETLLNMSFWVEGVMQHDFLKLISSCAPGTVGVYNMDPVIKLACVPCPLGYHSHNPKQECEPCPINTETLMIGASDCTPILPPKEISVFVYVGPALALFACILVVFAIFTYRKYHQNSMAPKQSPLCLVFTDIEKSTLLWQKHPKGMAAAVDKHNDIMRKLIIAHEGYEVKTIGDSFMIAFKSLADGVSLSVAIQEEFNKAVWPEDLRFVEGDGSGPPEVWNGLRIRIGVHWCVSVQPTFDIVHQRYDYYGHDVNVTARVESNAVGGQILMTKETYDVLSEADDFDIQFGTTAIETISTSTVLKGVDGTVSLMELVPSDLAGRIFPRHETMSFTAPKNSNYEDDEASSSGGHESMNAFSMSTPGLDRYTGMVFLKLFRMLPSELSRTVVSTLITLNNLTPTNSHSKNMTTVAVHLSKSMVVKKKTPMAGRLSFRSTHSSSEHRDTLKGTEGPTEEEETVEGPTEGPKEDLTSDRANSISALIA